MVRKYTLKTNSRNRVQSKKNATGKMQSMKRGGKKRPLSPPSLLYDLISGEPLISRPAEPTPPTQRRRVEITRDQLPPPPNREVVVSDCQRITNDNITTFITDVNYINDTISFRNFIRCLVTGAFTEESETRIMEAFKRGAYYNITDAHIDDGEIMNENACQAIAIVIYNTYIIDNTEYTLLSSSNGIEPDDIHDFIDRNHLRFTDRRGRIPIHYNITILCELLAVDSVPFSEDEDDSEDDSEDEDASDEDARVNAGKPNKSKRKQHKQSVLRNKSSRKQ